jgi:hypothetical protein
MTIDMNRAGWQITQEIACLCLALSLAACGGANSPSDSSVAPTGTGSVTAGATPPAAGGRASALATTSTAAVTSYEAESGAISGGANIQSSSAASGGRIVGHIVDVGSKAQLTVDGGSGGAATLVIRASNGYAATSRLGLYLNGVRQTQLAFAPTGDWDSFVDLTAVPLTLVAGINTISVQHDASDTSSADIDRFTLSLAGTGPAPVPTPTPTPTPTTTIVTAYEAESGSVSGGANIQSASTASGGRIVGHITDVGAKAQLIVDGGTGGAGTLVVRASNGNSGTSRLSLYLNGVRRLRSLLATTR